MSEKNQSQKSGSLFVDRRNNTRPTRREKLPWPVGQRFKILSLDGGGIRGLYGASILQLIEREITDGIPVAGFFDMIAGTSTGGIMALGLGLGLPASTIKDIYAEDGERIFAKPWYWKIPFLKLATQSRRILYNFSALEESLKQNFGDATLGDATTRVVIPAFMVPKAEIAVFKTDHHPDYKRDYKAPMWEIARATSAAPTYLGGHASAGRLFLDGGIWANNPVMVAICDALTAYDVLHDQIDVLSIGTGNLPFDITVSQAKGGLWSWREAINAAMYLTSDNAQGQAGLLLGPENILRLCPSNESAMIELDDWAGAMSKLPDEAVRHFSEERDGISQFFQTRAAPRHRFYTSGAALT